MSPAAVAEYEAATKYAPWFLPAYVNLAELQRQGGNEAVAEQTLRRALAQAPGDAGVLYALGLSVYRQQRPGDAVTLLAQAAKAAPEVPRYPFAYALALESQGRAAEALKVIDAALVRHPDNRDLLDAGLNTAQKSGDVDRAREYVRRLLVVCPRGSCLGPVGTRARREVIRVAAVQPCDHSPPSWPTRPRARRIRRRKPITPFRH